MKKIKSVEQAYEQFASDVLNFINNRPWDWGSAKYGILATMVSSEWVYSYSNKLIETGGQNMSLEHSMRTAKAVRFLRENILKTTDQRIWGLKFTLYPTGKFNIEYDYNKPEGYEETDEVITGEEINASLNHLADRGGAPS